jgi:hypothetical protein
VGFERCKSSSYKKGLDSLSTLLRRTNKRGPHQERSKPLHQTQTQSTKLMFGFSLSWQTVTQPSIDFDFVRPKGRNAKLRALSPPLDYRERRNGGWLMERRLPLLSRCHGKDSILHYVATYRPEWSVAWCQFWFELRRDEENKAADSGTNLQAIVTATRGMILILTYNSNSFALIRLAHSSSSLEAPIPP